MAHPVLLDDRPEYQYFEEGNPGILRFSIAGQRVLDVGCGYGALGEELKRRGNYVVGLDIEQRAVNRAKQRLDEAYVCDVTASVNLPIENGEPFDLIVFADILEHLYDPLAALRRFRPYLAPNGHIIVSLPNVASWPVRLGLLFGRFEYTESGILDKGHVRFFTRKTAKKLVEGAGFQIERITITPNLVRAFLRIVRRWYLGDEKTPSDPQAIVRSRPYRFYIRWVYPLETMLARLWTGFFAFQFIIEASAKREAD
jgi:2-polyprenyl-3-methyl-5-hydroxy-6-metoxy-1,4-benzoquinol methylase